MPGEINSALFCSVIESARERYALGQQFAALEAAFIDGLQETMPDVPEGCSDDPAFEAGYHDWLDAPEPVEVVRP